MDPQIEIINDIVASLNEKIIRIEAIVGHGTVNHIFVVKTNAGKLVIRLNDNRGFDEFVKEKWCLEQAAAKQVPSPQVLKLGEIDGYSYMVLSFLEGIVGSKIEIDATVIWEKIGKHTKQIHSIPVSGYGLASSELMPAHINTSHEKWKRFIIYNIESLNPEDKLIELGALNFEQSQKVKKVLEYLIQKQFSFGLNHGDLALQNVMVSKENKVSIFDWGSAEAQIVPHHDFGQILHASIKSDSSEFEAFLKGYGLTVDEFKEIEGDVRSFNLLRSIDKLRWAIDKHQVDIPAFTETVRNSYLLKFN